MPPNRFFYCSYNTFDAIGILNVNSNLPGNRNFKEWGNQLARILDKDAPLKSKAITRNNKPFIPKNLRKAILWWPALNEK